MGEGGRKEAVHCHSAESCLGVRVCTLDVVRLWDVTEG